MKCVPSTSSIRSNRCRGGRRRATGFTLVEILIVVIILGILASIVLPQFAGASDSAKKANMRNQLQTVRSTVQLYRIEHRDEPPPLVTTGWDVFTGKTKTDGTLDPAGERGPYLPFAPVNPLTRSSTVVAVGASASGTNGWYYDESTGHVYGTDAAGAMSDTGE
jgi:general secretion pathway protein G